MDEPADVPAEGRMPWQPQGGEPLTPEQAAQAWEVAKQRPGKKNEQAVGDARKSLYVAFASDKELAEKLGMTNAELNRQMKSWSGLGAKAMQLQDQLNGDVPEDHQWTGITNSSFLGRQQVSAEDIDQLVADVDVSGESSRHWYGNKGEKLRGYIARAFMAIDTRLTYKDLKFKVGNLKERRANGTYDVFNKTITIDKDSQDTVAHEIGHHIDWKFGEQYTGGRVSLADTTVRRERYPDIPEQHWAWIEKYRGFVDDLQRKARVTNSYYQEPSEVLARFIDAFTDWVGQQAGQRAYRDQWEETTAQRDKFNEADFRAWVRLLQEKSYIDARVPYEKKAPPPAPGTPETIVTTAQRRQYLYHTTTNLKGVLASGAIQSRNQLGGAPGVGAGAGTHISVTVDPQVALRIERRLKHFVRLTKQPLGEPMPRDIQYEFERLVASIPEGQRGDIEKALARGDMAGAYGSADAAADFNHRVWMMMPRHLAKEIDPANIGTLRIPAEGAVLYERDQRGKDGRYPRTTFEEAQKGGSPLLEAFLDAPVVDFEVVENTSEEAALRGQDPAALVDLVEGLGHAEAIEALVEAYGWDRSEAEDVLIGLGEHGLANTFAEDLDGGEYGEEVWRRIEEPSDELLAEWDEADDLGGGRTAAVDLGALVAEFMQGIGSSFASCSTVKGAYSQCDIASQAFHEFLSDRGIDSRVIAVRGPHEAPRSGKWKGRPHEFINHSAVMVDDIVVDLTAKQFDRSAPFPLIEPSATYLARWRSHRTSAAAAPWVAVDLDGTILSEEPGMAARGEFGEALPGAKEALRELQSLGWRISIYTARFDSLDPIDAAGLRERISSELERQGVPFTDVWVGPKPRADWFIDNKALHFDGDWDAMLLALTSEGYSPKHEHGHDGGTGLVDTVDTENDFSDGGMGSRRDRSVRRPPGVEDVLY
jgi:hypothetical protein